MFYVNFEEKAKMREKDKVSSEVDVTQTKNYLASVGNACANVQYAIEIIIILLVQ